MAARANKIKVMCEINSFAIVYFFFDDRQQTAWSQGSSKYQKQKKCTHSEQIFNPLDSSQRLQLLNTSLASSNVP
jgi:hypothetical protein